MVELGSALPQTVRRELRLSGAAEGKACARPGNGGRGPRWAGRQRAGRPRAGAAKGKLQRAGRMRGWAARRARAAVAGERRQLRVRAAQGPRAVAASGRDGGDDRRPVGAP